MADLKPEDRTKLDSIVQQMIANGESDDYIQGVVNDFKQKYAGGDDEDPGFLRTIHEHYLKPMGQFRSDVGHVLATPEQGGDEARERMLNMLPAVAQQFHDGVTRAWHGFTGGDINEAIQGAGSAVPVFGPGLQAGADEFSKGQYGAAAADLIGNVAAAKIPEAAVEGMKLIPRAGEAVDAAKRWARVSPQDPMQPFYHALNPSRKAGAMRVEDVFKTAIPELNETEAQNAIAGQPKTLVQPFTAPVGETTKSFTKLIDQSKKRVWDGEYAPAKTAAEAAGAYVSGPDIAARMVKAIPSDILPDVGPRALAEIEAFRGRPQIPLAEADAILRKVNADIDTFQGKSQSARGTAIQANASDIAVANAKAQALRDGIYDGIQKAVPNSDPALAMKKYGALKALREMSENQEIPSKLQAGNRLDQSLNLLRTSSGGKGGLVSAGVNLLTAQPTIDDLIWKGMQKNKGMRPAPTAPPQLALPSAPDQGSAEGPIHSPWSPEHAEAASNAYTPNLPKGLPAPPIRMPSTPDTSGPVPQPAPPNMGSTSTRQLPPASSQIDRSGVIVPDIMGQPVTQASPTHGGGRTPTPPKLPAPAPGQPPINIQPTGPGAIGPAGTTPLRSAETPIPQAGERGGSMLDLLRENRDNPPSMQRFDQPRITETEQDATGAFVPKDTKLDTSKLPVKGKKIPIAKQLGMAIAGQGQVNA